MIDEKLKAELVLDEDLRLSTYVDSKGNKTIGVGHKLPPDSTVTSCTYDQAMAWLEQDVAEAVRAVKGACPFALDDDWALAEPARWRALISMALNRGAGTMRDSKYIVPAINRAARTGDWTPVGPAISTSQWAAEVKTRAVRIRDALLKGGA